MAETAAFLGQPLSTAYLSSTSGEGTRGDPEAQACVRCPATLSFFHWAPQLHSVSPPRWEGGSHLQGTECWSSAYCCISAQSPGREYVSLIWKKGLWIPPDCSVFSTSSSSTLLFSSHLLHMSEGQKDNMGPQPARMERTDGPVSVSILQFWCPGDGVLLAGSVRCCRLRLWRGKEVAWVKGCYMSLLWKITFLLDHSSFLYFNEWLYRVWWSTGQPLMANKN